MTRTPESLAAWTLTPVILFALSMGVGLLVERVARLALPNALLAPVGALAAIAVVMVPYQFELGAWLAVPLLLAAAGSGFWIAGRTLPARLRLGPAGWAALGTYLLYLGPVIATGGWTWTGYNFVNDTAVQMLLADHLRHDGLALPSLGSTQDDVVRSYLLTGYPTGSHGLLGTLAPLVPAPLAALYQPFISALAALTALAAASLAGRSGLGPRLAALAGFAALAGNLTYNYALHGSIKEIAMLLVAVVAVAATREILASREVVRGAGLIGLCLGTGILVFSAGALPYVALLGIGALVLAWAPQGSPLRRRNTLAKAVALGAAVLVLSSLPTLTDIVTFRDVATQSFADEGARQFDYGHLLRPLGIEQTAGVWIAEDYRLDPPRWKRATTALIWLVFAAALAGVVALVRRRETALLLLFGSGLVAYLAVAPTLSPYSEAKLLVLLSPVVVLVAAMGIGWLARRAAWAALPAAVAAAAVLAGVLWSDAAAYHGTHVAPVEKLLALQEVGERYADSDDVLLVNESEEFAKYFMRAAPINDHYEPITPEHVKLRRPQGFRGLHFDIDFMELDYLQSYALLVRRHSPANSRPPLNWELDFENDYYEVWRRTPTPQVIDHAPLQREALAADPVDCGTVDALRRRARNGEVLVGMTVPDVTLVDPTTLDRPAGWAPHPTVPYHITTNGPGKMAGIVSFKGGTYDAWIEGSFGRSVDLSVDGRRVGSAEGIQPRGQWHHAGEVAIPAGEHRVELERRSGGLAPGDGYEGFLGPIEFQLREPRREIEVAPKDAGELCPYWLDWVELVRR